ncbi:DUF4333 domain-containing protein [Actinomycetospora termitidis]|uniref:DUF4333 domain-containing protein n=1 Tax=Actinomycetospora termitidis TaxID=3053470 RepID=A0ABT7M5R3_9PSEU|nr:DUF4333 domain-containing protein [Actinomycetospora sp. Odt1-22]MDL5155132.1 DUF4333 domain-containing protein [Actinomycetospora sp. Odt1-22]
MTQFVAPEPPAATTNGVEVGSRPVEASPPKRRKAGPILSIVFGVIAVIFGLIQLFGLFGPKVVDSSAVASEIQSRVSTGLATCSEDLPAKVGATISCSVLDGADTYNVRATVTAVDGDNVRYDLEQM